MRLLPARGDLRVFACVTCASDGAERQRARKAKLREKARETCLISKEATRMSSPAQPMYARKLETQQQQQRQAAKKGKKSPAKSR